MARLVGVDLPRDKRMEIALTYIYGIGRTRSLELLEATGISARVQFRAFRQHRGCTPMEFAKQVRLQRARQMLSASDASVTAVAFACGFLSTGHFARAYREAFGELPSETIRRSN